MLEEQRTLINISLTNSNHITSKFDLSGVDDNEEILRLLHSILDELKLDIVDILRDINLDEEEGDDLKSEIDRLL
jgi:hypothetical protein